MDNKYLLLHCSFTILEIRMWKKAISIENKTDTIVALKWSEHHQTIKLYLNPNQTDNCSLNN